MREDLSSALDGCGPGELSLVISVPAVKGVLERAVRRPIPKGWLLTPPSPTPSIDRESLAAQLHFDRLIVEVFHHPIAVPEEVKTDFVRRPKRDLQLPQQGRAEFVQFRLRKVQQRFRLALQGQDADVRRVEADLTAQLFRQAVGDKHGLAGPMKRDNRLANCEFFNAWTEKNAAGAFSGNR